jgi:hypothetical protein
MSYESTNKKGYKVQNYTATKYLLFVYFQVHKTTPSQTHMLYVNYMKGSSRGLF